MLLVNNVTKKYDKFTALQNITLEFSDGVYGLLSPNGAGKTTLMKMLATLTFPTSGEILWDGDEIVSLDEDYRKLLGYLPQKFGYYRNYSPRQFLRYMAALKGLDRKKSEETIEELIGKVALTEVIDKKMKKFSGGMLQRVGIAQALLNDPKILILDEPTAGLDPKERIRFRSMLHELSENRIVILSTHIVSDIETIADKIVMLRDHTLFACDTPGNLCRLLQGTVYETGKDEKLPESAEVLYERQTESGTVIRFYTEKPQCDCQPVNPNLEDVFLKVYGDGNV